ncbi:MAG: hypothetical protein IT318_24905 [Anaerolineales bacterium]|nr:hypothetical protein [Anaerolineales bacterium]
MAADPAQRALFNAREAESLVEGEPLPLRLILLRLIRAVIALAQAVIKLEDARHRERQES